ncbi:MAG: HlyD family type I secretion periplasmic adaptor subunit [Magnetococcales bacterium]|nr:HlyD family type I secretion periplasmic adaptor subunit [Magnetococcales bacterium]
MSASSSWNPGRYLAAKWRRLWNRPSSRVVDDAIPFQVGVDIIIAENPSFLLMSVFYLVIGMVVLAGVVASLVEVEMIVTSSGRLTTETPPLQIQPMDRAILRELKIKAGDVVTKGQVLATFDATFAHADLSSLLAQQQAVQIQIRRLDHEISKTPFIIGQTPTADERLQLALLQQRQAQHKSRMLMFDEDIKRIQANIHTTEDERDSLATLLKISKEVEGMRSTLQKSGTGSQLQYQEAQVARIRTDQAFQEAGNRLIELRHNLEAKKAERQTFEDEWTRQMLDNLIAARTEAAKLHELVIKAKRMSEMEIMTAPVDGVILDVGKRATGSVLNPGELLITLVPDDAVLIAEIMISSSDVGHVKTDDKVQIKVNAFPYQRHGLLEGRLMYVSQESFVPGNEAAKDSAGAFHVGRIRLTKTDLENMPKGARLIRGMTLVVNVTVGSRRLISYFLYSLTNVLDTSLRER